MASVEGPKLRPLPSEDAFCEDDMRFQAPIPSWECKPTRKQDHHAKADRPGKVGTHRHPGACCSFRISAYCRCGRWWLFSRLKAASGRKSHCEGHSTWGEG